MAQKIILITGVADYWGARLATRLMAEPDLHVIGLDAKSPPKQEIEGLDFIQADARNPLLVDLFRSEKVHTVCHLKFVPTVRPSEVAFDVNVMGTTKVLGACAEAGVRQVVLKSSLAVYGAHPDNPAFLTENHALRGSRRYGYTKDLLEIETFCNDIRRQAPDLALTMLRFASIVGPTADTPMTRFLKSRLAPVLLGFDPLLQIIHEDDVVEALAHVTLNDLPGVFNVAAEGVMPLRRIMALTGKPLLPITHPLAYWGVGALGGRAKLDRYVPIELDYLRYSWVADLAKMHAELGFAPHYTAEEALREFADRHRPRRHKSSAASDEIDEQQLRDTIERRHRARQSEKGE